MQLLGGAMKFDQASIRRTFEEIQRVCRSKRDYVLPIRKLTWSIVDGTRKVQMDGNGGKVFRVLDEAFRVIYATDWSEAEKIADQAGSTIEVVSDGEPLVLTRTAERQLYERLGIPVKFADRLVDGAADHVLRYTVDELADLKSDKVLVRCVDGKIRAILSNGYKVLDNQDLFVAVAGTAEECGAEVWKSRISDDRFEMFLGSEGLSGEIRVDRPPMPNGYRWEADKSLPDTHYAACWVSNSETGNGGLNVQPSILRAICANYLLWGDIVRTIHLGRRRDEEGQIDYADETLAAEAQMVWLKLRDVIKTTFNAERFQAWIDRLNQLTQVVLPDDAVQVVENVSAKLEISIERKNSILANLIGSRDLTVYGLVQSLTEVAHQYDEANPEAALELEAAGSKIAKMTDQQIGSLVSV